MTSSELRPPDAPAETTQQERLAELKDTLAALPQLTTMQHIRVKFKLYTDPSYVWIRLKLIYYPIIILYSRALSRILRLLARLLLSIIRPIYHPYEVIFIATTILGFGVAASMAENDWTWFSRSGSLLVVVAALLHVFDAKTWFERQKSRGLVQLDTLVDTIKEQYRDGDGNDFFEPLWRDVEACRRRIERYDVDRVGRLYRRYEVIAAICGTFVWGFGDLVGRVT